MKWFLDVFLPSLFDRAKKSSGQMWITEKQTSICVRYMTACKKVKGHYSIVWNDRNVDIQISPKNGCAFIVFAMATNAEIKKAQSEKIMNQEIKWLKESIADLEKYIAENPNDADDDDFEDLERYKKELEALENN